MSLRSTAKPPLTPALNVEIVGYSCSVQVPIDLFYWIQHGCLKGGATGSKEAYAYTERISAAFNAVYGTASSLPEISFSCEAKDFRRTKAGVLSVIARCWRDMNK
jgi:hypothetical protein